MKDVKIVIGANFGDEGKGLMTNYFASNLENPLVVRFNGGAQAGHTVVKDGERFIFSHFGSGTLAGVPTYFSKEFICNPLLFNKEYDELYSRGISMPDHWFNPECYVTTPFDIIINREIEKFRGVNRHGSCGVGIQETLRRDAVFPIKMKDLSNLPLLWIQMEQIRDHWIEQRAKFLGMDTKLPDLCYDERVIEGFVQDCEKFNKRYVGICDDMVIDYHDNIIFEGAQGLLLDQRSKYFPYVTPTSTGLENIVETLKNFDPVPTEVNYMTRCYMTRHGAGPFETECEKPYEGIIDLTNQRNEWQEHLRFGLLDIDLLKETIDKDFANALPHFKFNLGVSCLDQTNVHKFLSNGKILETNEDGLLKELSNKLMPKNIYTSHSDNGLAIKLAGE